MGEDGDALSVRRFATGVTDFFCFVSFEFWKGRVSREHSERKEGEGDVKKKKGGSWRYVGRQLIRGMVCVTGLNQHDALLSVAWTK